MSSFLEQSTQKWSVIFIPGERSSSENASRVATVDGQDQRVHLSEAQFGNTLMTTLFVNRIRITRPPNSDISFGERDLNFKKARQYLDEQNPSVFSFKKPLERLIHLISEIGSQNICAQIIFLSLFCWSENLLIFFFIQVNEIVAEIPILQMQLPEEKDPACNCGRYSENFTGQQSGMKAPQS